MLVETKNFFTPYPGFDRGGGVWTLSTGGGGRKPMNALTVQAKVTLTWFGSFVFYPHPC